MTDQTPLRIHHLRIENFMRILAVDVEPDGNVVRITGRNAQGKSSILNAIFFALQNKEASKQFDRPVHDGADTALVVCDLAEYEVTRRFTSAGTTSLEVRTAEGHKVSSPATVLNDLIGSMIDPEVFLNAKPKEQVAMLLDVIELPFDLDKLNEDRQGIYDDRTIVNREVAEAKATLKGMEAPDDDTPTEMVSTADLAAEHEQVQAHNRQIADAENALESVLDTIEAGKARIAELEQELEALRGHQERRFEMLENAKVTLADLGEEIDTGDLAAKIADAEAINDRVRAARRYEAFKAEHDDKLAESTALTQALADIDAQKAEAIAAANMPVDGLGFDDDGLLLNGVPFAQASSAERLTVGLGIAGASNPRLRVIYVRNGALFDEDHMTLLETWASEHDYQIWVERVEDDADGAIRIEDGRIVDQDAPEGD